MPLSWIAAIGLVIIPIVVVHDNANSLIIIVFNTMSYLKYLLFNKLHELMDSNIFVILS